MAKRRPSGDGMVRKREDGRWEGRIVVGHKNNGNPIYRYVLAKTQSELTQKLHNMIEIYRDADLSEECNMLLSEWLEKWINEYITCYVRPNTLFSYTAMIKNQINPHLGNRPLSALTTQEIQKFYNAIKKNGRVKFDKKHGPELADSMVRKVHLMLHEALDMAVKQRLLVSNPTNGTTLPKNNYAPKQILNDEQLDKFMNQIRQDEKWHDFFYTEITTGLRKGEICGLRWEDFDENRGTLKIKRSIGKTINGVMLIGETKTETGSREILLPPSTADLLRQRKVNSHSEWIFPDLRDIEKPMNPQCAYGRLKTILKQAGLPSIRFHDLRHTFATMALENGMDIKSLSTMLGHISSETTIDIYSHVTDTMRQQAAVKIDRKISGTEAKIQRVEVQSRVDTTPPDFEPYKPKCRKSGTGCVTMINDHLYEGRYTPTNAYGKRESHNIYAKTHEECEEKLAAMIAQVKAEIKAEKKRLKAMEESSPNMLKN